MQEAAFSGRKKAFRRKEALYCRAGMLYDMDKGAE